MCPEMILGLGSTLGPPGGTGGQAKGGPGGPVFLKSAFLVFLVIIPKLYIPSTPNNSNETHNFMCLGRTGRFGQR